MLSVITAVTYAECQIKQIPVPMEYNKMFWISSRHTAMLSTLIAKKIHGQKIKRFHLFFSLQADNNNKQVHCK